VALRKIQLLVESKLKLLHKSNIIVRILNQSDADPFRAHTHCRIRSQLNYSFGCTVPHSKGRIRNPLPHSPSPPFTPLIRRQSVAVSPKPLLFLGQLQRTSKNFQFATAANTQTKYKTQNQKKKTKKKCKGKGKKNSEKHQIHSKAMNLLFKAKSIGVCRQRKRGAKLKKT